MTAIGVIELNSIPQGVLAGDAMLKAAEVNLCAAQTVCAGKYIVVVNGEVAAVKSSVAAGKQNAGGSLVDSLIIPNADERMVTAMVGAAPVGQAQALGLIETFSIASTLNAADIVVKTAEVELIEIRLGRGMGGKSFVIYTGEVAAVKAAAKAVENNEKSKGLIGSSVVIPSPHMDIVNAIL